MRREGNIPASKRVRFVLKPAIEVSDHDKEVLRLLLNAEALDLDPQFQPGKGTPTVRSEWGDLFLPLAGLVDVAAEKARLSKEIEKAQTEIAKVEQKLANPQFVQKVPPNVLEEHQKRLAEWQAKKEHLSAALKALEE